MASMNARIRNAMLAFALVLSPAIRADQATCDTISAAYVKTGSAGVRIKNTGYSFARDTPAIYGLGDHTCSRLRDDSADGQPATVYREQYKAAAGATDATIWISKSTGRLLREEEDGDILHKGKGHISYQWSVAP